MTYFLICSLTPSRVGEWVFYYNIDFSSMNMVVDWNRNLIDIIT